MALPKPMGKNSSLWVRITDPLNRTLIQATKLAHLQQSVHTLFQQIAFIKWNGHDIALLKDSITSQSNVFAVKFSFLERRMNHGTSPVTNRAPPNPFDTCGPTRVDFFGVRISHLKRETRTIRKMRMHISNQEISISL